MRFYSTIFSIFLIVVLVGFLITSLADAQQHTIVIIRSQELGVYDEITTGILDQLRKSGFQSGSNLKIITQDVSNESTVISSIWEDNPDLIISLGTDATKLIKDKANNIPVVFSLVYDLKKNKILESSNSEKQNITGVVSEIPSKIYLSYIQGILSNANHIGLFYNPEESKEIVQEAKSASSEFGLELINKGIQSSKEVPQALLDLGDQIDAFWIITDPIVLEKNTRQLLLMHCLKKNIPVIGAAPNYVKAGAVFCLTVNYFDMGIQTGAICAKVLNGQSPKNIPIEHPRKVNVVYNSKICKQLNITLPPKIQEIAKDIEE